jgi:hypothetical protein
MATSGRSRRRDRRLAGADEPRLQTTVEVFPNRQFNGIPPTAMAELMVMTATGRSGPSLGFRVSQARALQPPYRVTDHPRMTLVIARWCYESRAGAPVRSDRFFSLRSITARIPSI